MPLVAPARNASTAFCNSHPTSRAVFRTKRNVLNPKPGELLPVESHEKSPELTCVTPLIWESLSTATAMPLELHSISSTLASQIKRSPIL